jgi:hypothetical protein
MTEALTVAPIHEDSTNTVKLTKQKGNYTSTLNISFIHKQ